MAFRIGFYTFAALLLGAHFLRGGHVIVALLCMLVPFAFAHRRWVSLLLLQVLAYAGVAVWAYTAWRLLQTRIALGQHWMLAAAILGAVALFSLLSGILLNSRVMHERYPK